MKKAVFLLMVSLSAPVFACPTGYLPSDADSNYCVRRDDGSKILGTLTCSSFVEKNVAGFYDSKFVTITAGLNARGNHAVGITYRRSHQMRSVINFSIKNLDAKTGYSVDIALSDEFYKDGQMCRRAAADIFPLGEIAGELDVVSCMICQPMQ